MILTVKISQGVYYTNLTRLFAAHKKGLVLFEEKENLKFFKTLGSQFIFCYQQPSDELISLPKFN